MTSRQTGKGTFSMNSHFINKFMMNKAPTGHSISTTSCFLRLHFNFFSAHFNFRASTIHNSILNFSATISREGELEIPSYAFYHLKCRFRNSISSGRMVKHHIIQAEHKKTLHFENDTENKCGILTTSHLH
jgi:hypothetical protein